MSKSGRGRSSPQELQRRIAHAKLLLDFEELTYTQACERLAEEYGVCARTAKRYLAAAKQQMADLRAPVPRYYDLEMYRLLHARARVR